MPPTQPYLYPPTNSQYSLVDPYKGFDPKAFTRASWATAPTNNFNRHPDSYLNLPYGETDAMPLPANTKKKVKVTRWVQLAVRVVQMLGALGMLVCVICIKNTSGSQSYIIRVPAAVDILSTGYAIYHLARSAKSRPPASSASYHLFSLIIDATIIPFYVFTALLTKFMQGALTTDNERWTTFFDAQGTNYIFITALYVSIVEAGLHVLTAIISIYLFYMFRKIANLPPDMNPLEDNLTSRRSKKYKHKYKNSELSTSSIGEPTLISSTRDISASGQASPTKEQATSAARPVSFLHTRTNSGPIYSPHNPITAEASRSNLSIPRIPTIYKQPHSARNSQLDLNAYVKRAQDQRPHESRSDAPSRYSHGFMSEPSTVQPSLSPSSSVYTANSSSTIKPASIPPLPRKSSRRHTLNSDNWFVHEDDDPNLPTSQVAQSDGPRPPSPGVSIVEEEPFSHEDFSDGYDDTTRPNNSARTFNFGALANLGRNYQPVNQYSSDSRTPARRPSPPPKPEVRSKPTHQTYHNNNSFILAPLGMNPPTPPLVQSFAEAERRAQGRGPRPLAATRGNGTVPRPAPGPTSPRKSPATPASPPKKSVGTPTKVKYYGDLNSAMAGVRGLSASPGASPKTNAGNMTSLVSAAAKRGSPERRDWAVDGGGRVISRSGVDAGESEAGDMGLRGRNVSGKVAEEGRGGVGWRTWGR